MKVPRQWWKTIVKGSEMRRIPSHYVTGRDPGSILRKNLLSEAQDMREPLGISFYKSIKYLPQPQQEKPKQK